MSFALRFANSRHRQAAKCFVVFPPSGGSTALTNILTSGYADGSTINVPWSADSNPSFGGWETSSGSASAGYSFTNFDSVINTQLSYGANSVGLILQPCSSASPNTLTPNYVFTAGYATSIGSGTGQLYTGASTNWAGAGTITAGTCAQGVDNTAFPACWQAPFATAWKAAVAAVLTHIRGASYASKIAYVRIGTSTGGEAWIYDAPTMETICSPATYTELATVWTGYRSSLESTVLANKGSLKVAMGISGGASSPISIPYSLSDSLGSITTGNGLGVSSSGLQNADIGAYATNGASSGGSATSGYTSNDWAYVWKQGGAPYTLPLYNQQTYKATDPTYPTNEIPPRNTMGSLVPLLPFALNLGVTNLEIYYADWQVAYDSSSSNYATYHAAYQTVIQQTRGY